MAGREDTAGDDTWGSLCLDDNGLLRRIERQLRQDSGGDSEAIVISDFNYAFERGQYHPLSVQKKNALLEIVCCALYAMVVDPNGHVSRLDNFFSGVIECNLRVCEDDSKIAVEAFNLLKRLPLFPIDLPDIPAISNTGYANQDLWGNERTKGTAWPATRVVRFISTNVIRVALIVATQGAGAHEHIYDILNVTSSLLTTASHLSLSAMSQEERCNWFIVSAFLWTSWQQMTQIYFHNIVYGHMISGFQDSSEGNLTIPHPRPLAGLDLSEMSKKCTITAKPDYMCGYAFEMIRAHPCAIGFDFRNFFRRFSAAFGGRQGRCQQRSGSACKGEDATDCQRFRGMKVEDQSAHNGGCQRDCKRLIWDRDSYINVKSQSGRAVQVGEDKIKSEQLTYTSASEQTLAISHVWSHGQGGRPEEGHGLNQCLHDRYETLARRLDCDSYWLDTACIPEEHGLRREAILAINEIFERSKITLICDRDIMSIDISDLSTATCETILITVMVCDWNLRAWTFLESFRARHNIHFLCKGDSIVSAAQVVQTVYQKGSLDIALLITSIPHLLPTNTPKNSRKIQPYQRETGFLDIESGAGLLSCREASRFGDDVVIWSLLLGDEVHDDAEAFWKSKVGSMIPLDFLLSSAPRLNAPGWRWAPCSPIPDLLIDDTSGLKYRIPASKGGGTNVGVIAQDGLDARWLFHGLLIGGLPGFETVATGLSYLFPKSKDQQGGRHIRNIRRRYLKNHLVGGLLLPVDHATPETRARSQHPSNKIPLVVVATNRIWYPSDQEGKAYWTWRGIYEWSQADPLPEFVQARNICIV